MFAASISPCSPFFQAFPARGGTFLFSKLEICFVPTWNQRRFRPYDEVFNCTR